jgi:dephospho-CoA kinase
MAALRVGLTGGLAAGKSTVGRWLEEAGFPIMDADRTVAELHEPGAAGAAAVEALFGDDFLLDDGGTDRSRLAELVFADEVARHRLEAMIHPLVRDRFEAFAADKPVAVLEATLLVESGLYAECDLVVTVEADPELRLQRAVARGMGEQEARQRLRAQGSLEQRCAVAHRVVWNNGSRSELRQQVDGLIEELKRKTGKR